MPVMKESQAAVMAGYNKEIDQLTLKPDSRTSAAVGPGSLLALKHSFIRNGFLTLLVYSNVGLPA